MSAPENDFCDFIQDTIAATYTAESYTAGTDRFGRSKGMNEPHGDASISVTVDYARERAGKAYLLDVGLTVQFYLGYDAQPDENIVRDATVIQALGARLRDAFGGQGSSVQVGDAWYLRLTGIEYPVDPTGNKTRYEATFVGEATNTAALPSGGASSPSSTLDPATVSGLTSYFDADDLSLGAVPVWTAGSGAPGGSVHQANAGLRPTCIANGTPGHNAVRFDSGGSPDYNGQFFWGGANDSEVLPMDTLLTLTEYTLITVVRADLFDGSWNHDWNAPTIIGDDGLYVGIQPSLQYGATNFVEGVSGVPDGLFFADAPWDGSWAVICARYDNQELAISVNDGVEAVTTTAEPLLTLDYSLVIGGNGGYHSFDGDLAAALTFNRNLDPAERTGIVGWLIDHYGLV